VLKTLPRYLVLDFLSTLTPYVNTRPTHYLTTLWSLAIDIYLSSQRLPHSTLSSISHNRQKLAFILPLQNLTFLLGCYRLQTAFQYCFLSDDNLSLTFFLIISSRVSMQCLARVTFFGSRFSLSFSFSVYGAMLYAVSISYSK